MIDCGCDPEFGMEIQRGCTDCLFALLFLLFFGTMLGTIIYSFIHGEPKALTRPYDFTGNICGVNETVKEYGKLYFTSIDTTYFKGISEEGMN